MPSAPDGSVPALRGRLLAPLGAAAVLAGALLPGAVANAGEPTAGGGSGRS